MSRFGWCAALCGSLLLSACDGAIKPNISPIRNGLGQIEYLGADSNFVQYTEASFQGLENAAGLPGDKLSQLNAQILRTLNQARPAAQGGKILNVSGRVTGRESSAVYDSLSGEIVLHDAASGQTVGRAMITGKAHSEQPADAVLIDFAHGVAQLLGWR